MRNIILCHWKIVITDSVSMGPDLRATAANCGSPPGKTARFISDFSISYLDIERIKLDKQDFVKINIPGTGIHTKVGYPELPVILRYIEVPNNNNFNIEIVNLETEILYGITISCN